MQKANNLHNLLQYFTSEYRFWQGVYRSILAMYIWEIPAKSKKKPPDYVTFLAVFVSTECVENT